MKSFPKPSSLSLLGGFRGAFFSLLIALGAQAQTKVSVLGDSYSTYQGYVTPESNLCWYAGTDGGDNKENDVSAVEQTWWHLLITAQGLQLERNNSYSGSTVCNTGYNGKDYSDRSFITRMTDLGQPDIILVFGGTNDSWAGSPIGKYRYKDWTEKSLYSFRPAFCRLMDYLTKRYPDARIINITNTGLKPVITETMAEVCRHYGVANLLLHDIDKQWGHPSQAGMRSICEQVAKILNGE